MSNFLRKGKRQQVKKEKKETKHRVKEFYNILGALDDVANIMMSKSDVMDGLTAENLEDRAKPYIKRKIDSLEKMVLMGKLGLYQDMDKELVEAKKKEVEKEFTE